MQKEMNLLFKNAQSELTKESDMSKIILKATATRLATLKSESGQQPEEEVEWLDIEENKQSPLVTAKTSLTKVKPRKNKKNQ